eukprot:703955_1
MDFNDSVALVTLNDVRSKYNSEAKAYQMLNRAGLIGKPLSCAKCALSNHQIDMDIKPTTNKKYKRDGFVYPRSQCDKLTSIRHGTLFHGSPKTLAEFIDIIFTFASLQCSIVCGSELSNRSKDNVGKWYNIMRRTMSAWFRDNPMTLGSDNEIVEIDETCMTRKMKYRVGHLPATPRWILGFEERWFIVARLLALYGLQARDSLRGQNNHHY